MKYCDICISSKATICIQIYGRDKINMVYSCKSCADMFADPLCSCKRCTKANKKTLEQDVQPERSNVHHIQSYQQPWVSLAD